MHLFVSEVRQDDVLISLLYWPIDRPLQRETETSPRPMTLLVFLAAAART